jgi:transposase
LGWYLKEELRELWNQPGVRAMKRFLHDWCDKALDTAIPALAKMAKTLLTHASGILNYAKHPITSARLEGINNKIKTLTKKSYHSYPTGIRKKAGTNCLALPHGRGEK